MKKTTLIGIGASLVLATVTAAADIKVGFIGSLSSDTGLSTLRGAEIAVEDIKADKPAALSEAQDLDLGEDPGVQHLAILDEELANEVGPPTRVGPPTKDPQSDPT